MSAWIIAAAFVLSGLGIAVFVLWLRHWRIKMERAHEALLRVRGYFR